jgi:hypothetical protein
MTKSHLVRERAKAFSERLNAIANYEQAAVVKRNLASTAGEALIAATHTKKAEHYEHLAREVRLNGKLTSED